MENYNKLYGIEPLTTKILKKRLQLKNPIITKISLALYASSLFFISPLSATASPIEFTTADWQVVCDNTLTCRLAGYHSEKNSELPVSVLLTRRAGLNASIEGKLKIGRAKKNASKALMQLGNRHRISLVIDDKDLGQIEAFSSTTDDATLTGAQVKALTEALTRSSKIELVMRNTRWQLSDKGATAVMMKADEAQGRVGNSSAFLSPQGISKPNNGVLPAKEMPSLRLVTPNTTPTAQSNKRFSVRASKLAEMMNTTLKNADKDCPKLSDSSSWRVNRLNGTQLLAQHNCWSSAYNAGIGMWVMNDTKPHQPTLVTTNATDYRDGKITAVQKGRSIGDCLSKTNWIWTGRRFTKSHESTTGLCRMIDEGGAWALPTYVTDVKTMG